MAPRVRRVWGTFRGLVCCRRAIGSFLLVLLLACCCCRGKRHVDLGHSHASWKNASAEIYVIDTRMSRIEMYGHNSSSERVTNFETLREYLDRAGTKLVFATNGGMFQSDYAPVGLLVQDGVERSPINLRDGDGNFFLKPNGVFVMFDDGKPVIVRSDKYLHIGNAVRSATQSGPMLVIDGKINSAFKEGSTNRLIRSGVGVKDSHTVVFAISDRPVNFWDFANLFRDSLGCKNALYLDGVISKFYVPGADKLGHKEEFGVLIGATEKHEQ